MHIPEGFGVVTPYLLVDDAEEYIRFLGAAFGGCEIGRSTDEDGRIVHSQIRFASSIIMLSEATERYPATRANYYLYVSNAELTMQNAEQAGAQKIMDVADMPYGDRQGGVRDRAGNVWWVSERQSADPYF